MDFPHNCGSLLLSFSDIAALLSIPNEPAVSGMNPTIVSSAPGCCFKKRKRDFVVFFSFYSNHSSICLSCLFQCANRASTSPRWEIRSVQNVRLTASLTTRGRCSVAVKRTTSVLRETPWPWPVPVSLHFFLPNRPFSKIFSHAG